MPGVLMPRHDILAMPTQSLAGKWGVVARCLDQHRRYGEEGQDQAPTFGLKQIIVLSLSRLHFFASSLND